MMLSNGGVVSADDAAQAPIRLVESGPAAGALAGSVVRRAARRRPAAVLRHGRHHRQVVPDHRRRAGAHQHVRGGPHLSLQEGLRVPGVGAVGRPRRDRRRRRQPGPPRRARPAQGRPRVAGRRPGPGVLRPRRHATRRSPMPTSRSACSTPATSSAATCRSTSPRPTPRWRRSPTSSGLPVDRHGGRHSRAGQPEHGRGGAHARRRAGRGSPRRHAARVRRRRPRSTPAVSPSCWSRPQVIFPVNASVLSAFGTLVSPVRIDLARSMVRPLAAIDRGRARRACSTSCATRAAACSAPPACGRRQIRFRYGLDARYLGQGNEITLWVGEGEQRGRPPTRSASPAFEADYRRIYGLTIPDVADRGRHVAAVGVSPSATRSSRSAVVGSSARRAAHGTGRCGSGVAASRRHAGLPAQLDSASASDRRPGDRRGARDHRGDPPRLDGEVAADGSLIAATIELATPPSGTEERG